ncbi:hypothetical protein [Moellerella wisconsensis]
MVHSVSDAANKIVAMNNANVQFSDILNRWATETGTITVTLPDGTKQQLRTAKEMDKQLDGKFDKAGGTVTGALNADGAIQSKSGVITSHSDGGTGVQLDGRGAIAKLRGRNKDGVWFDHVIPESSGTLMQVGDYGLGRATETALGKFEGGCFVSYNNAVAAGNDGWPAINGAGFQSVYGKERRAQIFLSSVGHLQCRWSNIGGADTTTPWHDVYTTANTTKDSNGNLKAASPIVKVFADYIELNDESEGVELKCLHTGIYQLKHVLGLNSDASWGGINGGITIPSGINQLPLIYVDYDVLVAGEQHPFNGEPVPQEEHGDIVIYTSYRKHFDLPQNVQRARLKTYPEFTKLVGDERVELENGAPVDIPAGHWVDVRVNMPEQSIYNQKQAEAEAYAKEEAERAEQEAVEQVGQQ